MVAWDLCKVFATVRFCYPPPRITRVGWSPHRSHKPGASAVRICHPHPNNMKLFEATVRVNGREFTDRVGANDAQEARLLLQQRHGPRAIPYMPRMIPS